MLTYQFNSEEPLYEQLYKYIRDDIMNGILLPGEKLPSKRTLAKQLNISTITIESSYAQLLSEGFIESKPRVGYFVNELNIPRSSDHLDASDLTLEETKPDYRFDFSSSQSPSAIFPFSTWAKITRSLLTHQQEALMQNSPANGTLALRQAIAKHLYDFSDLKVSPYQIVIGAGTEYLYGLLIQLLGFDKTYGVEWPGYQKIRQISRSYHVNVKEIAMDESGIMPNLLRTHNVDIIHITPSHQYPTGITMPIKRRYELLQWALEDSNHYVVEDDYDSEFSMAHRPVASLFSIDQHDKVIYMNTFNKKLASTIRISYMVLPEPLAHQFNTQMHFYACTVSTFEQYTLAQFIQEGYFEKHINRLRTYYRRQRDDLITALHNSPLNDIATISKENTGLHLLIHLDLPVADEIFLDALKQQGIHLSGFVNYGLPDTHTFIINYASIDQDLLKDALKAIYEVYCSLK
ncbi:MAG: PLP-dependent aminotransferase family protein [Erysipelotrichaceae bacterium]|nr:PLP-dependent aminotransferase family protein [Erysipelotrichaceae bacterium]